MAMPPPPPGGYYAAPGQPTPSGPQPYAMPTIYPLPTNSVGAPPPTGTYAPEVTPAGLARAGFAPPPPLQPVAGYATAPQPQQQGYGTAPPPPQQQSYGTAQPPQQQQGYGTAPPQQQQGYGTAPPPPQQQTGNFVDPNAGHGYAAPHPAQRQAAAPTAAEEEAKGYVITVNRVNSTSAKIQSHESFPRISAREHRLNEHKERRMMQHMPHIVPASSEFVRVTNPVIPSTPQLLDKYALPLAFSIRPLADGRANDVPVVNFAELPQGGAAPVRCRRCRGYINPYCQFIDGGRRWQCSICRGLNDVPAPYFCQVDPQRGLRLDVHSRPELCHGVYDLVAPSDYLLRPPQRPTFVFLLDLSYAAAQTGLIHQACLGITDALWRLRNDAEEANAPESVVETYESLQVSIVGFDSVIYLFNLRPTLSAPKMIVAPDLANDVMPIDEKTGLQESVELPALHEDLVVSVKESFDLIMTLLEKLPIMFDQNANAESAFGPAVQTAISLLNPCGGKVLATMASCPSVGEGRLQPRDDGKLTHLPKEHTLTTPGTEWYKNRALAACQAHVSFDLFCIASANVDLGSIAPIVRYTGGHLLHETNTNRPVLHRDIARALLRESGYEAVLRIRTPPQLGAINFFGHFYVRGNDMLSLPVADSDSSYTVQLNLQTAVSGTLFVQCALLYTTRSRERRIRVYTFPLEVSPTLPRVYNQANQYVIATVLAKAAVDQSVNLTFQACIANLSDKVVKSLRTFKSLIPGIGRAGGMLVVPQSMQQLPLLLTGYMRCPATRHTTAIDTPADVRVASMCLMSCGTVDALVSLMSPSTHCIYSNRGDMAQLPRPEVLSLEALKHDAIYLIDFPGSLRALWFGKGVDRSALEAFGIPPPSNSPVQSPIDSRLDQETLNINGAVERYEALINVLDELAIGLPAVHLHTVSQGSTTSNTNAPPPSNSSFSSPVTPGAVKTVPQPGALTSPTSGQQRVVTERTLATRMIEDDAKEAVGYPTFLAQLQRRANSAE